MAPLHDFTQLYAHYSDLIAQMPETFTSHEFILHLAQRYQDLYVEALYSYRRSMFQNTPAPFMNVHRELARHLLEHPQLITQVDSVESEDIFGTRQKCPQWRKR